FGQHRTREVDGRGAVCIARNGGQGNLGHDSPRLACFQPMGPARAMPPGGTPTGKRPPRERVAAGMTAQTAATRAIAELGIAHEVTVHGKVNSLEEAAAVRGVTPDRLLKTLV